MATFSTFINAQTNDYELLDGKVVFANELATEAYSRIVTPLGTYLFDPNFGCELFLWLNTRVQLNSDKIVKAINNALQPMISEGRAISISTKVNSITLNLINFTVNITDTNNKIFRFTIPFSASNT